VATSLLAVSGERDGSETLVRARFVVVPKHLTQGCPTCLSWVAADGREKTHLAGAPAPLSSVCFRSNFGHLRRRPNLLDCGRSIRAALGAWPGRLDPEFESLVVLGRTSLFGLFAGYEQRDERIERR
jgi:hypothetical protein